MADSYTNSVLTLMEGLSVPRKALIGPWAHVFAHDGMPQPAIDFLGEATKWWDKWLKGVDNDTLDCRVQVCWKTAWNQKLYIRLVMDAGLHWTDGRQKMLL